MAIPLLIAHRGDTVNFPENTIAAFHSAFEKGAKGIELDVQFYHNQLIVVHDYLFDNNKTYPKLSEVLNLFSGKGRLEIEVKSMDLDFLIPLQNLLKNHKNRDIEITTSVFPITNYLSAGFPNYPLGIIFHEKDFENWMTGDFKIEKITKFMKLCKARRAHLPHKEINESVVNGCHTNGFGVHGHIYRQSIKEQLRLYNDYITLGIDQCTFDDINLLSEVS